MSKSPEVVEFLDDFTESNFGMKYSDALAESACVLCKGDAIAFRDDISRKEYTISGMCQSCQDDIFGVDDDE